jgi:hypothetical protein
MVGIACGRTITFGRIAGQAAAEADRSSARGDTAGAGRPASAPAPAAFQQIPRYPQELPQLEGPREGILVENHEILETSAPRTLPRPCPA